jgi:hypothetical protein
MCNGYGTTSCPRIKRFVTLNFEEGMSCFCADFNLPFCAADLFCPISWPCRLRPGNGGWRPLPCGLWLCGCCRSFCPGIDACGLLLWSDGCSSWPFEDGSSPGDFFFKLGRLFLPAAIVPFLSAWAFFPRDPEPFNPRSVDDNVAGWPVYTLLFLAEFTGPAFWVSTIKYISILFIKFTAKGNKYILFNKKVVSIPDFGTRRGVLLLPGWSLVGGWVSASSENRHE